MRTILRGKALHSDRIFGFLIALLAGLVHPPALQSAQPETLSASDQRADRQARQATITQRIRQVQESLQTSDFASAIAAQTEIRDLETELYGEHHVETIGSWCHLAMHHIQAGNQQKAAEAFARADSWLHSQVASGLWEYRSSAALVQHVRQLLSLTERQRDELREAERNDAAFHEAGKQKDNFEALRIATETLKACRRLLPREDIVCLRWHKRVALSLLAAGHDSAARSCISEVDQLIAAVYGARSPYVAAWLRDIGWSFEARKNPQESWRYHSAAWEMLRQIPRVLIENRLPYVRTVFQLAQRDKNDAEAIAAGEQIRLLQIEILGEQHPDTISTIMTMALMARRSKQYERATELYREGWRLREASIGRVNKDTATAMYYTAYCLQKTGRVREAIDVLIETIDVEKQTSDKPADVAVSIDKLAAWYAEIGDYSNAAKTLRELIAYRQSQQLPEESAAARDLLKAENRLALSAEVLQQVHQASGRFNELVEQYKAGEKVQAISEFTAVYESLHTVLPEDPETYRWHSMLADMHYYAQQYPEAERLYRGATTFSEDPRVLSETQRMVAHGELGRSMLKQNRAAEAEREFRLALEFFAEKDGLESKDSLILNDLIVDSLVAQERIQEARQLLEESVRVLEDKLGRDHDDTLQVIDRLAELCADHDDSTAAEHWYRVAITTRRGNAAQSEALSDNLDTLAGLLTGQNRLTEALAIQEERLQIVAARVGDLHAEYRAVLHDIGHLQLAMGEGESGRKTLARIRVLEQKFNAAQSRPDSEKGVSDDVIRRHGQYMEHIYLGRRMKTAKKLDEAVQAYQRAFEYAASELPELKFTTRLALEEVAPIHRTRREFDQSRSAYERVLAAYEAEETPDAQKIRQTRAALAELALLETFTPAELDELQAAQEAFINSLIAEGQQDLEMALTLSMQALEIRKRLLQDRHPDVVFSERGVGFLLGRLERPYEALPHYEESLRIAVALGGRDFFGEPFDQFVHNLDALSDQIASNEIGRDQFPTARKRLQQLLDLRIQHRGEQHFSVDDARWSIRDLERLEMASPEQREHIRGLWQRYGEATKLVQAGQLSEAHDAFKSLHADCIETLGENHPQTAKVISWTGSVIARARGGEAESLKWHQRAEQVKRAVHGLDHPETLISISNVAFALSRLHRHEESRVKFREHLEVAQRIYGSEHAKTAEGHVALGEAEQRASNYQAAEEHYRQAQTIYGKTSPQIVEQVKLIKPEQGKVTCTLRLAQLSEVRGHYFNAQASYESALSKSRSMFGDDSRITAEVMSEMAGLLIKRGDYTLALANLEEALDIQRKTLGSTAPATLRTLVRTALLLDTIGQSRKAWQLLRGLVEEVARVHGSDSTHVGTLASAGAVVVSRFDPETAANLSELFDKILAKRRDELTPLQIAEQQFMIAIVKRRPGDFGEAERLVRSSLDYQSPLRYEDHPEVMRMHRELALCLLGQGRLTEARRIQSKVLRDRVDWTEGNFWTRSETELIAYLRHWLTDVGVMTSILEAQGDTPTELLYYPLWELRGFATQARSGLKHVLEDPQITAAPGARILHNNWKQYEQIKGELAGLAALSVPQDAQAAHIRKVRQLSTKKQQLERQFMMIKSVLQPATHVGFADLGRQLPDDLAVIDLVSVERWALNDAGQLQSSLHYEAYVLLKSGSETGVSLRRIPLGPRKPIDQAIREWRAAIVGTETVVTSGTPAPAFLRTQVWEPLETALGETRRAVVIPAGLLGQLPWSALPGRNEGQLVLHDYALCTASNPQQVFDLLQPRDKPPEPQANGLLLVGNVNYDEGPPSQTPSVFQRLLSASTSGSRGPVISENDRPNWQMLPSTRQELAEVARIWKQARADVDVETLSDSEASESSLKAAIERYEYVHLATHGYFAGEQYRGLLQIQEEDRAVETPGPAVVNVDTLVAVRNPLLLSAVVLSGANREPPRNSEGIPLADDGYLTAEEVVDLKLNHCELVVLAACETGVGNVSENEGVFGLQRAFQQAGARSTIASLWSVPDDATQMLMSEFYKNLWERRLGRLESLRQAQLTLINGYDGKTQSLRGKIMKRPPTAPSRPDNSLLPAYYWAAFTLNGDWN